MQQQPRRLRRAVSSLLALLALFVGAPLLLIAAARSRFDSAAASGICWPLALS